MSGIDFSISTPHVAAFALAALFPLLLFLTTRPRRLKERNGLQFLLASIVLAALWGAMLVVAPATRPDGVPSALMQGMTLAGALIVYLEIWALLSRGYTLGILLTLLRAGRPLTAEQIAQDYRFGKGLAWIMDHRLAGLASARLIVDSGGTVTLTSLGRVVAIMYRLSILVLGIGRTG